MAIHFSSGKERDGSEAEHSRADQRSLQDAAPELRSLLSAQRANVPLQRQREPFVPVLPTGLLKWWHFGGGLYGGQWQGWGLKG